MKVVVGIPARMGSSRFPGKPLVKILGMPMLEHVYRRCALAETIDDLFVATCDEEIKEAVEAFGGRAIMTRKDISRPGLRVAEAVKELDLDDDDIVVVVQGDEPLVYPGMIDLAVQPLLDDPDGKLLTLVAEANEQEWQDPNEVKMVMDKNGNALFMTRAPVPTNTRNRIGPRFKQVAIMPFRKKFLLDFQAMEPMPLEVAESVELLRALEHGVTLKTADSTAFKTVSVDTEPDRQEAEKCMKTDPVYPKYKAAGRVQS